MKPRGLVVCVDCSDTLALTLEANMRHLSECWVITSTKDTATQSLCRQIPNVHLHITDLFYENEAYFNKGIAVESCLDAMGRTGWLLIHDADILLPDKLPLTGLQSNILHGARRHVVPDPRAWSRSDPWDMYEINEIDVGRPLGFFQLFDTESPHIRNVRPWYGIGYDHAGGCDGHFENLWPRRNQRILETNVLHLGPVATNWFGRATPFLDGTELHESAERRELMRELRKRQGW